MVFKRNTLKNTKTFKQSTSINTSKINNPQPVKHIPTKKRTTYTAGSGSGGWAVSDSIKSILNPLPQVDATTTYDTNAGYADGKFQDDSKMSVYDENNPTQFMRKANLIFLILVHGLVLQLNNIIHEM